VILYREDGSSRPLIGPTHVVIPAGELHGVEAVTDAVWLCIHSEASRGWIPHAEAGLQDMISKMEA
jgi:hypothetical protein